MDFRSNYLKLGLMFTLLFAYPGSVYPVGHRDLLRITPGIVFVVETTTLTRSIQTAYNIRVYSDVFDFDCRRPVSDCLNGGACNYTSGKCECKNNDSNYQCDTDACPEGFYGDDCTLPRVQVNCTVTEMFVNINPYGDDEFKGGITVYEKPISDCSLKSNGTIPNNVKNNGLKGYRILLNHHGNDSCGAATREDDNTTTTMIRQFLVIYDPDIRSPTDQIVTARCIINNGMQTIKVTSDITTIQDQNNGYKPVSQNATTRDVTLEIKNSMDNVLTPQSTVKLGDDIHIVIKGASYIAVKNCSAVDGLNTTINFLKDGCVDPKYRSIYVGTNKTDTTYTISLKAFRFRGSSSSVIFNCYVNICSNQQQCQMTDCDSKITSPENNQTSSDNSGSNTTTTSQPSVNNIVNGSDPNTTLPASDNGDTGRRKRSSGSEGTSQVSASIKVLDGTTQSAEDNSGSQSVQECSTQQSYLTVVIVLAVIVAILTVSSSILIFLLTRSRSKVVAHHSNKLVQPVQTMRLPRLDLNTSQNQPF